MDLETVSAILQSFQNPNNEIRITAENKYKEAIKNNCPELIKIFFQILETSSNVSIIFQAIIQICRLLKYPSIVGYETHIFMKNQLLIIFGSDFINKYPTMKKYILYLILDYIQHFRNIDQWQESIHYFSQYIQKDPILGLEFFTRYYSMNPKPEILEFIKPFVIFDNSNILYLQKSLICELIIVRCIQEPNELLTLVPTAFSVLPNNLIREPLNEFHYAFSQNHIPFMPIVGQMVELLLNIIIQETNEELIRRLCLYILGSMLYLSNFLIKQFKLNPSPFFNAFLVSFSNPIDYPDLYSEAEKEWKTLFGLCDDEVDTLAPFIRESAMNSNPFISSFFIIYIKDINVMQVALQYVQSTNEIIRKNSFKAISNLFKSNVILPNNEFGTFLLNGLHSPFAKEYIPFIKILVWKYKYEKNQEAGQIILSQLMEPIAKLTFSCFDHDLIMILSDLCQLFPEKSQKIVMTLLQYISKVLETSDDSVLFKYAPNMLSLLDMESILQYFNTIWPFILRLPSRFISIQEYIELLGNNFEPYIDQYFSALISYLPTDGLNFEMVEQNQIEAFDDSYIIIPSSDPAKRFVFNNVDIEAIEEVFETFSTLARYVPNLLMKYLPYILQTLLKYIDIPLEHQSHTALTSLADIVFCIYDTNFYNVVFDSLLKIISSDQFVDMLQVKFIVNILKFLVRYVKPELVLELVKLLPLLLREAVNFYLSLIEKDLHIEYIDNVYYKELFIDIAVLFDGTFSSDSIQIFNEFNQIIQYFAVEDRHPFFKIFSILTWTDFMIKMNENNYPINVNKFLNDLVSIVIGNYPYGVRKIAISSLSSFCSAKKVLNIDKLLNLFINLVLNDENMKIKMLAIFEFGEILAYNTDLDQFDNYFKLFLSWEGAFESTHIKYSSQYYMRIFKLSKRFVDPGKELYAMSCVNLIQKAINNSLITENDEKKIRKYVKENQYPIYGSLDFGEEDESPNY